jgi:hypothetical protein
MSSVRPPAPPATPWQASKPDLAYRATQASGVLVPPLAFLTELSVTYAFVPRACDAQRTDVLHWVVAAAFAVIVVAGALAWRDYYALGKRLPGDAGTPEERARFLALLGVLTSALFALAVLAQAIAQMFLSPCIL